MEHSVDMASGGRIHMPSFMTIGSGAQTILRFGLNNLRGCSVGIIAERDL
jgi:hypothetical protein